MFVLEFDYDLGLNVLNRLLSKGFIDLSCDTLECMAYNINLDLVIKLFDMYPKILTVSIWSNSERMSFSPKNQQRVLTLIEQKRVRIFHLSENVNAIHGKLYLFKKNGSIVFLAVGSPNFSEHSNLNFECLVYIYDAAKCQEIWNSIPKVYQELNWPVKQEPPTQLYETVRLGVPIDPKLLEGLWKHESVIIQWLVNRIYSIVNVPPGTGKTDIALVYLRYLLGSNKNLTVIVLVPTITLLDQWKDRLSKAGIPNSEWGSDLGNLGEYFADPSGRVLVTLYSRFYEQYRSYGKKIVICKPDILLVLDECHSTYGHNQDLLEFRNMIESSVGKLYSIGLSATLDTYSVWEQNKFMQFMGGDDSLFEITLQSFYSNWNNLNPTPVLKPIRYVPLKYRLNGDEEEQLRRHNRRVAIEMQRETLTPSETSAAIQRARWLRGLGGGVNVLRQYIVSHLEKLKQRSTIIFVQTNMIAEEIQEFITDQPAWDPEASIYVYDSTRNDEYRRYAMDQFKKNSGFCLISERMLSEGFDLPRVDAVILHGSYTSPRDWIQKVGRAIRYDPDSPDSTAEIVDVVFCDSKGEVLPLEKERYECLTAIGG